MYRLMTRFLIVLGLVLATSMTGYARMTPMPMTQAVSAAGICLDHGCNKHQNPDHSRHSHMAAGCIALACAGVLALPMSRTTAFRIIDSATVYHPPVLASFIGIPPVPDAPPPRSLSLI